MIENSQTILMISFKHSVSLFFAYKFQLELESDADHTVCTCDHLTNFGIFLDWEGTAPDHDPGSD